MAVKRNTIHDIAKLKFESKGIVCLTSYSYRLAGILDKHCDILLVGDSLGMVLYGMENTLGVSLNMMINHAQAVVKGSKKALVVVDMPFATYQASKEEAFKNAAKLIAKSGAQAVKLEGGKEMAETIDFITTRGIPVMAHIGLLPQSYNNQGGYKIQGKDNSGRKKLISDFEAVEKSGAFAVVVEGTDEKTTEIIYKGSKIPVIAIGSGVAADGQILVTDDILGLTENPPSFAKRFVNLTDEIDEAARKFAEQVKSSLPRNQ